MSVKWLWTGIFQRNKFFFPACKVVTESLLALLREQAIEKPYLPTLFTKPEVKFVLIRPGLDKVLGCCCRIHHPSSFTACVSLTEAALEMREWVGMGPQLLPGRELASVVGEVRPHEEGQQVCQLTALGVFCCKCAVQIGTELAC